MERHDPMSHSSAFREDHLMGRVALVTGAAGAGIGQAIARRLAAAGATIVLTDNHERRLGEVHDELARLYGPAQIVRHHLDVGDPVAIANLADALPSSLGHVDILVNNAAVNVLVPTHEMDPEDWARTMAVDLTGPWLLRRALLPAMLAAGDGSIVNITSVAAYVGAANEGPYAAAKAALHSLTRTIASEGAPRECAATLLPRGW
jgi:3-oxoacyl-[acyl-carrier protein] reductase